MAYYLNGVVGRLTVLERQRDRYSNARVVPLTHGFAIIPLTSDLRRELDPAAQDVGWDSSALEEHAESLTAWLRDISRDGAAAYLEALLFGDSGGQEAIVWRDGEVVLGPVTSSTYGSINEALRFLGVPIDPGQPDEFDTLGLGRHRRTDQWVERRPIPPRLLPVRALRAMLAALLPIDRSPGSRRCGKR